MKNKWNKPSINEMGIKGTEDIPTTLDLGHGYDDVNHKHHCTCGVTFTTWVEAQTHERTMTNAGLSAEHNIGCTIIS